MTRYKHAGCGGSYVLSVGQLCCTKCGEVRPIHTSMRPAVQFAHDNSEGADQIVWEDPGPVETAAVLGRIMACIDEYRARGAGLVPIVTLDRVIRGEP